MQKGLNIQEISKMENNLKKLEERELIKTIDNVENWNF